MKDPAKVVPLFAAGSPAPAANAASLPLPERLLALMQEPLDDLLVAADDVLFDWAKKAVGEEAETCFVLMRQLRRERGEVIKRFAAQLAATPPVSTGTADAFDFEALKLQDDDALEEDIAIGNMTARIAEQVQAPLAELADRVEGARRAQRPMEGLEAVQPRAICRAFTDALHAVETTISLRLLLLKLFERAMLPQLPGFYAALNLQLSDLGFERIEKDPARKPKAAPPPVHSVPEPPERFDAPLDSPWAQPPGGPSLGEAQGEHPLFGDAGVNPWAHAQAAFPSLPTLPQDGAAPGWSAPGPGSYASETRFAQEMSELFSPHRLQQAPRPLAQRLDIVNRLFQGVRDDPMVRPELRPSLDALRYPLFKAALTDPSLISNPQHPLRRLVDDATVLASARNLPLQELRPVLAELVDLAMSRLSPSAHQAREGLAQREALPEDALQGLETQLKQSRHQRRRRLVDLAADGARQTLVSVLPRGRRLALEAEELVGRELVPLLALADLNFGRDSRTYEETRRVTSDWVEAYCNAPVPPETVKQVVDNLAEALVWARYPSERRERIAEATRALLGGQPEPQHHDELLASLSGALAETSAGAPQALTEPPATAPAALSSAHSLVRAPHERISLGGYASIWDAAAGRARWLSLSSRDTVHRSLLFMDFCQEIRITLSFKQFDADVLEGRSRLISG
jgi:hypothetical protein